MRCLIFLLLTCNVGIADFASFHAQYRGLFFTICRRHLRIEAEAEDCVQNVFLRIFRQYGEDPELEEAELRAIAKHVAIDMWRHAGARKNTISEEYQRRQLEREFHFAEPYDVFGEMIATLEPEDRELLRQFILENKSCAEIVSTLGLAVSERTIQRRIRRIGESVLERWNYAGN